MLFARHLARPLIVLTPLALAACLDLPMGQVPAGRPGAGDWGSAPPAASVQPSGAPEAACRAAAHAQGLEVLSVTGISPTALPDGTATGANVMLRVQRGAQVYDQRCHYALETGMGRIMAL
jgi:hypothetical protein